MNDTKPFEPTPSRIARARREGDVPRSVELGASGAFAAATVVLFLAWKLTADAAADAVADAARGTPQLGAYLVIAACALAPAIAAGLGATLTSIGTSGGIAWRAPRFEFGKLNPANGLKRMLSARTAAFAARAFLAACVAGCGLVPIVQDTIALDAAGGPPSIVAAHAIDAVRRILLTASGMGLALGVLDAFVERFSWRRRLRMSLDEMKRDLKANEGDPQLRNRRRAQHRALLRGSLTRLSDAAFVVANPTHVAVALEYRPPVVAVPRVLIRAVDAGARAVKVRARELGIPVIEDIVLARMLLATTHIDDVIPRQCYLAVARIVASLLRDREAL